VIGLFANEKHAITNEIDVKKIEQIIDKIKYINDNLCHYVIKLYYEYSDIISENNVKDINEELKHKYKNNIIDIKNDIQKIKKCNLIIPFLYIHYLYFHFYHNKHILNCIYLLIL
jgi:hypothetical protein